MREGAFFHAPFFHFSLLSSLSPTTENTPRVAAGWNCGFHRCVFCSIPRDGEWGIVERVEGGGRMG